MVFLVFPTFDSTGFLGRISIDIEILKSRFKEEIAFVCFKERQTMVVCKGK